MASTTISKARQALGLLLMAAVTACGGGGGSPGTGATAVSSPPAGGTGQTGQSGCSLVERQNWAAGVLNEWYLFPETLPASLSPAGYATVSAYLDALTATARSQGRDRYFTYLTSIADENAYYNSGSTAGFGFRVASDTAAGTATITEAFEGAPAFAAGVDRGDRIVAIGTDPNSLRQVSDILAASGAQGVTDALGPSTAGTTRTLQLAGQGGNRTVTITKANYTLQPLSPRYGSRVLDNGGRPTGYINLRTFISTGDAQLRQAFAQFRQQGITDVIIDLRYNGGGLVASAELMGDLLGRNRFTSDVFDRTTYRPEKSANNTVRTFTPQPESIAPTRIAFIGTGATASASELVINGMVPWLGNNIVLVGANTYGKPVGQVAIDRSACDDRLRVIAFATQNGAGNANYFNGLAATVPVTCSAGDDASRPLGDANEASVGQALAWLRGTPCTPIATGQRSQSVATRPELLTPLAPTAAQRDVPGLF